MQSRWFHKPSLHAPAHGSAGRKVGWLELFYDLIFVAAIIQLGDFLSARGGVGDFGLFALYFAPLWLAWTGFSFYANRFIIDDVAHRLLVFLHMFTMGAMAIFSRSAMEEGRPAAFALAYALSCLTLGLLYYRAWKHVPDARDYARYWGGVFGLSGLLFAVSAALPHPSGYLLWGLGMAVIFFSPLSEPAAALTERHPLDMEHLAERFGLLTIIVLGESFVKVLSFLTGSGLGAELSYQVKGFFNLGLTCSLWWIYFDDIAGSELRRGRTAFMVWLFGHLPLALGMTAVGVAVKKTIKVGLTDVPSLEVRLGLAGALALVFLSVAAIDSVTERANVQVNERVRIASRVGSAALLAVLALIGGSMTGGVFMGLVTAICAAQVIFDMMMAPTSRVEAQHVASALAPAHHPQAALGPNPRASAFGRDALRIGAPAEMRRDLYFFFLEGSWTRAIASFAFLYIAINVLFAGLFMLDPEGIGGTESPDFASAFFLSVQTFGTIGYGVLHPKSDLTNLIVTAEAATSMIFVALATGTVLAKAARPRAAVLFSRVVVIHTLNGLPTLMVRAANARGNDVAEASVSVALVMESTTPEGHRMRRVQDLKLVRDRQPMFGLSWSIMHVIDESSPLYGMDLRHPRNLVGMVITLMGHDGTYNQTIYARQLYDPSHLRPGHRFVDVMGQTEDGRLVLDLTRFHDTEPALL